jgi:hypothetical protein
MRSDMAKILVDWRRPPSRIPRGRDGRRFRDSSDAPFLPMTGGYRKLKILNENQRPLARYLEAQVNRPWNWVYRQICAVIDRRWPSRRGAGRGRVCQRDHPRRWPVTPQ